MCSALWTKIILLSVYGYTHYGSSLPYSISLLAIRGIRLVIPAPESPVLGEDLIGWLRSSCPISCDCEAGVTQCEFHHWWMGNLLRRCHPQKIYSPWVTLKMCNSGPARPCARERLLRPLLCSTTLFRWLMIADHTVKYLDYQCFLPLSPHGQTHFIFMFWTL